jgi:hypothetical protein
MRDAYVKQIGLNRHEFSIQSESTFNPPARSPSLLGNRISSKTKPTLCTPPLREPITFTKGDQLRGVGEFPASSCRLPCR